MHNNRLNFCRVCGFDLLEPPWGEDGHSPTFNICPCCGAEFGYHDCTEIAVQIHREKWMSNGMKWFENKCRPEDWEPQIQLKNIPRKYQ